MRPLTNTRPGPDAPKKKDKKDDDDDEDGVWVGLDLGTSNSTCAVWDQTRGGPKWCRLPGLTARTAQRKSGRSMPSVVRFVPTDATTALVGSPALQPDQEQESGAGTVGSSSSRLIRSVKRLLGKRSHELDPQWLAALDYEVVDGDDDTVPDQLRIIARIASSCPRQYPNPLRHQYQQHPQH